VHITTYAAWPMAILHGLLAGRHAKPYVDWSYGACLALVALALAFRYVVLARGRNAADPSRLARPSPGTAERVLRQLSLPPPGVYQSPYPAAGYQANGYLPTGYPPGGPPPGGYLPPGYPRTPPLRALPPGTGQAAPGPAGPGPVGPGPNGTAPDRFLPPGHEDADLDYGQPWTPDAAAYFDGGQW
jgi:hypothetical protein